jgi:hypothetical protein
LSCQISYFDVLPFKRTSTENTPSDAADAGSGNSSADDTEENAVDSWETGEDVAGEDSTGDDLRTLCKTQRKMETLMRTMGVNCPLRTARKQTPKKGIFVNIEGKRTY